MRASQERPVSAGVFGEISSSGDSLVILATGDDYELDQAAGALRKLTPLLTRTRPPGALGAPLTWPVITQLAHTFNGGILGQWCPGPKLAAWIQEEFLRRAATENAAATVQPAKNAETAAAPEQIARTAENIEPAPGRQPAANVEETARTAGLAAAMSRTASLSEHAATVDQPASDPQPVASTLWTAKDLKPRPYQESGAAQIASGGKFLLFDDPGTGKTATTILGLIKREKLGHAILPMVIIVPSWDVADVWARHIADWAPHWPAVNMYGGKDRHLGWGGIAITTYATATRDAADAKGPLARLKPASVVCDEVHAIKNDGSKRSRAVRRIALHAGTFVGLSGTPITRDTGDIYPALDAMDPLSWPARDRFVRRYCSTEDDGYGEKIQGLEALREPEFRAALMSQYRRVAKSDVLSQLPPKVYSARRVEIPAEWRPAYDGMEADMLSELPDGSELEVMSVLAQLTRLSQLASSACDVELRLETDKQTGEVKKCYDVTLKAPSWKADALLEILAERPQQQVAVFTVSRQLAEIAGAACEEAGYRVGYITGSQKRADRQRDILDFQAGKLNVIMATAGAGSLGITLTSAGTAVMLQRSWQLDQALQSEDRLHRIGQVHDMVEIIDVIARNTVEDRVRELLKIKAGRLAELVRDPRIVKELLGGLK